MGNDVSKHHQGYQGPTPRRLFQEEANHEQDAHQEHPNPNTHEEHLPTPPLRPWQPEDDSSDDESDEEEEDDSSKSNSDDSDYNNDSEYVEDESVKDSEKIANLTNARLAVESTPVNQSYHRAKPRGRKPDEPTPEQIKQWQEATERAIKKGDNLSDCLHSFMICFSALTPYQRNLSLFFLLASATDNEPWDFLTGYVNARTVPQSYTLANNLWQPPQLPVYEKHMKQVIEKACHKIAEKWLELAPKIRERHERTDFPEPNHQKLYKMAMKACTATRSILWNLWHSWPGCADRDVTHEVMDWVCSELRACHTVQDFWHRIADKYNEGLEKQLDMAGQTRLDEYFMPVDFGKKGKWSKAARDRKRAAAAFPQMPGNGNPKKKGKARPLQAGRLLQAESPTVESPTGKEGARQRPHHLQLPLLLLLLSVSPHHLQLLPDP